MTLKKFLFYTLITIVFYRVLTYIFIYFIGTSAFWHTVDTDPWNHYQIGAVLIGVYFLLTNTKFLPKFSKFRFLFLSIGFGMIIDEVSDIVKLLHLYKLPLQFRNSSADLLLIFITYVAFALIVFNYRNLLNQQHKMVKYTGR